ncbi:PfkB family carbohydrate kinase [Spirillospora sp. CA-294931]|uniref:PfkB family carbohydrate kinase n=1 Tax=Spirillospora sp. CA-294931 TaxID=3240042 RepID=UPI003D927310
MSTARAPVRPPVLWPGLDGAERRRFRLVVMGDVRIEVRAPLPGVRFTELTSDRLTYAPARALVAGTAVNLARRATGYFRRVAVLGRIGDDDFTPVVRRELRRMGVRDLLGVEPGAANGITVMLRDRGDEDGPAGVRLLVAEEHAPDRRLGEPDVRRAAREIRRADVLFADGYALLSPVSRAAVRAAISMARENGTLVAFDLVPHDVDQRLTAAEVLPILELADVVISEAPTLARLLDRPAPDDTAGVRELLPTLDRVVSARPLWLLRYGGTSLEHVVAHLRERFLLEYPTGYEPGVERTGFGDRLACGELYWWLSTRPSA